MQREFKHSEAKRAKDRKYYHEVYKEKRREYYQKNRDYILARQRAYERRKKLEKLQQMEGVK